MFRDLGLLVVDEGKVRRETKKNPHDENNVDTLAMSATPIRARST